MAKEKLEETNEVSEPKVKEPTVKAEEVKVKKEKPKKEPKAKPAKAAKVTKEQKKLKEAAGRKEPVSKKKKRLIFSILAILSIVIIAALLVVYVFGIIDKLFDSRVENMDELAAHDANSINEFINESWDSLELMADKLVMYNLDLQERNLANGVMDSEDPTKPLGLNLQGCLEYLNMERANSTFDKVYIFTEDTIYHNSVTLYSDTYVQTSEHIPFIENEYVDILNRTPSRFVIKYLREDTWVEDRTDALYYGVMLNNSIESNKLIVSGVEVVSIMARMDLTSIQDKIKIDCYDGQGYTSIIDSDGNYIASVYGVSALGKKDNYFDQLGSATFSSESSLSSVDDVKKTIIDGKASQIVYTDASGVEKVATTTKLQDVDWTVVMTVNKSVFDSQSKQILLYTTYFMVGILALFLVVVIIGAVSMYTGVNTRAEVKARNDFMAIMSHEIRTPLNAIIGYNRLARMNANNKDKLKEYLQKEGESSDYLLGLLNDILDLSEMQNGPIQLNEKPSSIESIIYSVIAMQRNQIQKKNLKFGAKKSLITPYLILDENRMKQVVMNIMSNAVKFTDQGQIFMTVTQEKVDDEKVKTIFKISDTGCGMTPEMKAVIFDAFTQDRDNNTMCLKGTGLGMAINKMIVDAMGGTIEVESELNKGSTFTVSFVSKMCNNQEIYEYKKNMHVVSNDDPDRRMKVLIVEDNELNAEILSEILIAENFKVAHAEDGAKAIEMFAASAFGEFDVVLMDIRMPVMDGFDSTKGIRSLPREDAQTVPIFACTANAFKEDEDKAYAAGMDDFLTKPIDITQMLTKLQNLHSRRK